jgi:hypothetical protein
MAQLLLKTRHNIIPQMEWEVALQDALALTRDQTRFAVSFLGCILAGIVVRALRSPTGRCTLLACACTSRCREMGARGLVAKSRLFAGVMRA